MVVRYVGTTSEKYLLHKVTNSTTVAVKTDMNMDLYSSFTKTL